jgi:WD40 repeat protein/DNA-binding SARP family transcriptional activator
MLQIRLLGQFDVRLNGKRVVIPSRAGQSLLAYLALTAGSVHRRERLAGSLWPDTPEERARKNLRQELWRIRKAIPGEYILADEYTVTFNREADAWLDTAVLEATGTDPGTLASGLALYQGELLPGFYDDWLVIERERVQALFESKMESLVAALVQAERWPAVQEQCERWLAFGSAPEPAYRALMLSYGARGDAARVSATYQRCQDDLYRKFGVEPSAETQALYSGLIKSGTAPQRTVERTAPELRLREPDEPAPGEPPFKGLQYFDEPDAGLFFGREGLTAKLVESVCALAVPMQSGMQPEGRRSLAVVVGASGSGKSSLVRAGLIPALRRRGTAAPGEDQEWRIHVITPTAHPLQALAMALTSGQESVTAAATLMDDLSSEPRSLSLFLARADPHGNTLLVVDQFEELFTLCREDFEREAFIDNLLEATSPEPGAGRVTAVVALRADFYAHLAQYPDLRDVAAHQQEYIGPMTAEELRRAIEEPARRAGWSFDAGLVDLILRDAGDEPGALPLLSHALLETWKRRAGRTLTLQGYAEAGGVRGAIAHTAESVYRSLSSDEQALARDIFLRLTEPGEGTEDTRRRAAIDELTSQTGKARSVRAVLNRLAEARLVILAEEFAEVAHEALIREWPTLREWLDQDREGLRLHRRLTEAAQDWVMLERDPGALYRGTSLAQTRDWAALHPAALNEGERAFLAASIESEQRVESERIAGQQRELEAARKLAEAERQRAEDGARSSALLRLRSRIITVMGAGALALAAIALFAGARAEGERRLAVSRELSIAALNNLEVDPERSMLLALQALRQSDTPEARDALHRAVQASRLQLSLRHDGPVEDAVYSPDGSRIATASDDGFVRVWDATSGAEVLRLETGPAAGVAFSPDGARLATADYAAGAATLWNAATGEKILTLTGHAGGVNQAVFSPDGTHLATAGEDGTARVWDLASGEPLFVLEGHTDIVGTVAFHPDGTHLITGSWDCTARVWDMQTGAEVRQFSGFAEPVEAVYSPDGSRLALSSGTQVLLWTLTEDRELFTLRENTNLYDRVLFSPDGQRLATANLDGKAKIWDAETGEERLTLAGHSTGVFSLSFSPDGSSLVTAGEDGTARVWDLSPAGSREWLTLAAGTDALGAVEYSPDGARFATTSDDGTARVFDAETGNELLTLKGHTDRVDAVTFSSDGTRLVTSSGDNTIRVWDAATGEQLSVLSGHGEGIVGGTFSGVLAVAYSPDGTRLATAGADGTAILWDARTGEKLSTFSNDGIGFTNLAFSPDGSRLALTTDQPPAAVTGEDAELHVYDLTTNRRLFVASQPVRIWGVDYSSDGARLVTGGFGGTVLIRDAQTGAALFELSGHTSTVLAVVFSPDDRYVATASGDGTARLWDAETGAELLTLTGHDGGVRAVTFSPDGTRLATAGRDGTVRVYLLDIQELMALAQARLTRALTIEECTKYLHRATCP